MPNVICPFCDRPWPEGEGDARMREMAPLAYERKLHEDLLFKHAALLDELKQAGINPDTKLQDFLKGDADGA